uniref:helix-turn-helix transcriptional regulator n=1 Tax=Microbulbifer agarilyticus TaxID=260552 RepID=UPI000255BBC5|nr:LuxR C-terminal-related transcriptional regulator [Microbulbifer agarilyticus]
MSVAPNLFHWHQCVSTLLDCDSDSQRVYALLRGVEQLVHGNSSMAILYHSGNAPEIVHHRLLANEQPSTQVDRYIEGAYLFDPFYRAVMDDEKQGLFFLREVAPDAFSHTEYFRKYYREANLGDEACYLVLGRNGRIASLSIGRARDLGSGRFNDQETAVLHSLTPVVENILRKWMASYETAESGQESFGKRLDSALENFGSSRLTNRECEVLHLTMRGHSIKSMAERLDASVDTVKTHRKNIYAKLDVTSQSELFYLFISALRQHSSGEPDPLLSLERQLA